jgi:RHS repeat-associated protein
MSLRLLRRTRRRMIFGSHAARKRSSSGSGAGRKSLLVVSVVALVAGGTVPVAQAATTPTVTAAPDPTKAPPPKDRTNDGTMDGDTSQTPAATWAVDSRGSFTDRIPLTVPAFHGIAPQLALSYDSSTGNGWTGPGWTLSGLSRIERGGDRKGSPRYDASDVFYLDGEPLIPCAAGSTSPSCTSGGTHSTRTESYTRIALTGTGADSRWTVTTKDGTTVTFAPVYLAGADKVFRWGISKVTDTRGNTVTYTWSSDALFGSTWDHPVSITYNGTTISFSWEARPDSDTQATGSGGLTTITGRIKTVDVSVGGSRLRAYKLSYDASADTARSLLTSVQQYGRDAVLDASGTITGGTALPAITTQFQTGRSTLVAGATTTIANSSDSRYFSIDINGDGRTDLLELAPGALYKMRTWISNGTTYTLASEAGGPAYSSDSRFITGDFNGDGKSDFVELFPYGTARGRRLWLSTGSGFTLAGTDYLATGDARYLPADLDGDGRTDMIELRQCSPLSALYCRTAWISNGTGFTAGATDDAIGLSADRQFLTMDVNGDGRQDMVDMYVYGFQSGQRRVWLSTGTGFVLGATDTGIGWIQPKSDGSGSRFLAMDVNGDDRDDMVELFPYLTTYTRRTWLSTGDGFTLASTDATMPMAKEAAQLVGDVNGDGRWDMIAIVPVFGGTQRKVWLSTGTGFRAGATDTALASYSCGKTGCTSQFLESDLDGNGVTEMLELYTTNFGLTKLVRPWNAGGQVPDLMTSRTNEWGGTTSVSYTPSSSWTDDNNPAVRQTTSAVTTSDGRLDPATTHFTYAGGHYAFDEQRSVGYRTVRQTKPCNAGETACPYTETTYRQDHAAAMKPAQVEQHAGDGTLLASTVYEYQTNGNTLPWTAPRTGVWETAYAGTGTACPGTQCRRTYTTSEYNAYGEVTRKVEYGDYDKTGDERTTSTDYVPNQTAYVVNKPAEETKTQGITGAGDVIGRTRTSYDGAAWNQPPIAGQPTDVARWLNTTDSYVHAATSYDSTGNVVDQIDEVGAHRRNTYDPDFHLFPVSETNALDQTTHTTWDTVCGQPTRKTDLNGQDTTYTYDALCRLTQQAGPGGHLVRYTRANLGNPATQYEQTERPAADGSSTLQWSRNYLDGMHRTWRKVDEGPDQQTGDIYVDTTYNARGKIAAVTQPYYWVSGQARPTTYATTTDYDALDRSVRTGYADGAHTSTSYGAWTVTKTDENGQQTTDLMNADGKRVSSTETVGGKASVSTYDYDLRMNLVRSTDPLGNVITYTEDSLDRTTKMVDPSWGQWTFEWDAAGHMTAETDAKGQRTEYGYDLLGRRIHKTSLAGAPSATEVSWTYDEDRAGWFNLGTLTTMTDAAGTKSYDHDAEGRVVRTSRTIDGTAYTYRYGFDAGDRLLWTTYPDGDTLGTPGNPLRYDGSGRLRSIPDYVDAATYTAAGKLTKLTNSNGTTTTMPYDAQRGWLTGITTKTAGTTIQDSSFTRDAKGLITKVASSRPQDVRNYTRDEGDQLISASGSLDPVDNQTWSYDLAGNIASNSRLGAYHYSADHPDQVIGAGANSYTYDAAGMTTSGGGRTMTWNGDNQLASVTRGGVTTNFTYDGDGFRIQQTSGNETRRYLGEDVEVDGSGTYTKYVAIAGTVIARKDGATRTWLHADQVGTIVATTDASGAVVDRWDYSANGVVLSGPAANGGRGFTGHRQDATGLVYMNARFYDPELGRFISPDPTIDGEDSVGLNRYAYVANNPVDSSDPTGLCKDLDLCPPRPNQPKTNQSPYDGGRPAIQRWAGWQLLDKLANASFRSGLKELPFVNLGVSLWGAMKTVRDVDPNAHGLGLDPGGATYATARMEAGVISGVWTFADNELLNIPGTIKYGVTSAFVAFDHWRGWSDEPYPDVVVPIFGQLSGCTNWFCA